MLQAQRPLFTLRLEVDEGGRSLCVLFVVCHRWGLAVKAEISNPKAVYRLASNQALNCTKMKMEVTKRE